jgi:hypothetical protein
MSMPPPRFSGMPGAVQREHTNGTTVLVLGILSLVVCGFLGPVAWSMGNKALHDMDAEPMYDWRNRGNVVAGRICGMIASVLTFVIMLVFAAALLLARG